MTDPELVALNSDSLKSLSLAATEAAEQYRQMAAPPTDEDILRTLQKMAEMFQVSVPSEDGLELYVAALRVLPRPAFVQARETLLRTHKWPRLPYPADFIEAGERGGRIIQAVENMVTRCRDRVAWAIEKQRQ